MSTLLPVTTPCPDCGAAVSGEVVVVGNLGKRPDLRQAILDRTWNVLSCACGHRIAVVRTSAALDFGRLQWLVCYPRWAEVHWRDLAAAVAAGFRRNLGVAAPEALRAEQARWAVRVVFGPEALREKLVIWDAGLDDRDVERGKIALLAGRPDRIDDEIALVGVDHGLIWRIGAPGVPAITLRTDRALLSTPLPAGFSEADWSADPFVSARRWFVTPRGADPLTFDLDGGLTRNQGRADLALGLEG